MATLTRDLKRDFEELGAEGVKELQIRDGLFMMRGLTQKTPVDTGRARGGWFLSLGDEPDDVGASQAADKAEGQGRRASNVGQAAKTLNSIRRRNFTTVWITNNVGYIPKLEFGLFDPPNPGPSKDPRRGRKGRILVQGGFSTQAPEGMVRVTFEELRVGSFRRGQ